MGTTRTQRDDTGSDRISGAESLGLLRHHLRRRTPWDVPWWPYVVAIGATNIARQLLLPEMSTATRIVTFAVMVLGVGLLVTVTYRALARGRSSG